MTKKTKTVDILAQKQIELNTYKYQFVEATQLITNTIDKLSAINDNIDTKIAEIEAYEAELVKTKTGLTETKDKNAKVIKNFGALLEV